MKILVVGGGGFLGSHCVDYFLEKGAQVTALDHFKPNRTARLEHAKKRSKIHGNSLTLIDGSIGDSKIWKNIPTHDAVIHVASYASPETGIEAHTEFQNRVSSMKWLLDWIREKKIKMLVLGSPGEELYGETLHIPTDERTALNPISIYGASKLFAETYISTLCRTLKDQGEWVSRIDDVNNYFSWASLRFGCIYGPRQTERNNYSGIVPYFTNSLLRGEAPELYGDGTNTRDYLYVSDAVRAIDRALQKMEDAVVDDCFNIASNIEIADIDIFDEVLKNLHERAADEKSSLAIKNTLKILEPILKAPRTGEVARSCLNVNKAELYLDWRPLINLDEGIALTIQSILG